MYQMKIGCSIIRKSAAEYFSWTTIWLFWVLGWWNSFRYANPYTIPCNPKTFGLKHPTGAVVPYPSFNSTSAQSNSGWSPFKIEFAFLSAKLHSYPIGILFPPMVNVCLSIHLELLTPIQLWLAVTFLPTLNKPHRHSNLHPPLGWLVHGNTQTTKFQ